MARPGGVYAEGDRTAVGYDRAGYCEVPTGYAGTPYGWAAAATRVYAPGDAYVR